MSNDPLTNFIVVARGQLGLDGVRIMDMGGGLLVLPVVEDKETWERRTPDDEPPPPQQAPERVETQLEIMARQAGLRVRRGLK